MSKEQNEFYSKQLFEEGEKLLLEVKSSKTATAQEYKDVMNYISKVHKFKIKTYEEKIKEQEDYINKLEKQNRKFHVYLVSILLTLLLTIFYFFLSGKSW